MLGVFCATSISVGAQNTPVNLVPNGGFEERTGCPNGPADLSLCQDWNFQSGTVDYFHQCGTEEGGLPLNYMGFQESEEDSSYIGLSGFNSVFSGGQEITFCNLLQPLDQGEKYRIRFKASYADSANYAICCVGVILSTSAPTSPPFAQNLSSVELVLDENDFNTTAWFQYDGVYTAQGGEDKIYLGTFRPESEMNPVLVRPNGSSNYNSAYFYIDDVEVYEDTVTGINETDDEHVSLVYDQGQGKLSVNGSQAWQITVLDLSGRVVRTGTGHVDVSGLSGVYVVQVHDGGVPVHTEKMVLTP